MELILVEAYDLERTRGAYYLTETFTNRLYKAVEIYNTISSTLTRIIVVLDTSLVQIIGPYGELLGFEGSSSKPYSSSFLEAEGIPRESIFVVSEQKRVDKFLRGIHIAKIVEYNLLKRFKDHRQRKVRKLETVHLVSSTFAIPRMTAIMGHFKASRFFILRYHASITPAGIETAHRKIEVLNPIDKEQVEYDEQFLKNLTVHWGMHNDAIDYVTHAPILGHNLWTPNSSYRQVLANGID